MFKVFYGILCLMIVFIIFSSVFTLRVRLLENNINKVNNQINDDYETLQNLKAEWNYLNNPEYLKLMANKYLKNMKPNSLGNNNDQVLKVPLKLESQ